MNKKLINLKMKELAKRINYKYKNLNYLKSAMYSKKIKQTNDGKHRTNYTNDSLATLGDAVLKLIISEINYDNNYDKKDITENRIKVENNDYLFKLCCKLEIYKYAYNDNYFYEASPQENKIPHSKHDVYVEALIGAIYKDRGLNYTKKWYIQNLFNLTF